MIYRKQRYRIIHKNERESKHCVDNDRYRIIHVNERESKNEKRLKFLNRLLIEIYTYNYNAILFCNIFI